MEVYIKKNKNYVFALLLILLVGIFLRTYNFRNWVRFNDDQARDATWTQGIIEGNRPLPLVGPKAGSTEFRLGPMYYYFQYTSARVFGDRPDALAYPDLFFSILTIPLLFVFLKKYFSPKESLLVTAVFSVSAYVVEYSRFAWNPNSLPFFSLLFLYALLEIAKPQQKRPYRWAAVAGITLGVGVQLHVLFLTIVPVVAIIFFVQALRKKMLAWKTVLAIALIALFLNGPSIWNEIRTGGVNTAAFFSGVLNTSDRNSSFTAGLVNDGMCHVRQNAMIVSSLGNVKDNFTDCHHAGLVNTHPGTFGIALVEFVVSALFSIGGYVLFWYFIKREKDARKKLFLQLLALYAAVSFAIFAVLASELTARYFLIVEFIPFILLGLWIRLLAEKWGKKGWGIAALLVALLAISNMHGVFKTFAAYEGSDLSNASEPESVTLQDQDFLANYIVSHALSSKVVIINDQSGDLFGMRKAMRYLTNNALDIKQVGIDHDINLANALPYFAIDIANVSQQEETRKIDLAGYSIANSATQGRFAIFEFTRD